MKKLLILASLQALCLGALRASTITIDAEVLKDIDGTSLPLSGLVVLTAGSTGNFTGPTAGSFVTGGEIIVSKWDLSGGFSSPGVFSEIVTNLTLSGAWDQGDPLRLYWYPTLSLNSTQPEAGTRYGTYSDPVGVNGSAPWITPGPSDTVSLKFFTNDASFLNTGGSNPSTTGLANATVVPEPSTLALSMAMLAAGGIVRPRRRSVVPQA